MKEVIIKTDPALLDELKDAAKRTLTDEERRKQRVSFIYSGLPKHSSMSKVDIERALKRVS